MPSGLFETDNYLLPDYWTLIPLHDNSFSMSMSVCVYYKLMHESKTVVYCTMHPSSACWQPLFSQRLYFLIFVTFLIRKCFSPCVCVHSSAFIWLFILVSFVHVTANFKQRRLGSWEWQLDPSWTWSHSLLTPWICLCIVIINACIHTQHLHTPSACMHTSLAVFGALDVVNVASDIYRVKSALKINAKSHFC